MHNVTPFGEGHGFALVDTPGILAKLTGLRPGRALYGPAVGSLARSSLEDDMSASVIRVTLGIALMISPVATSSAYLWLSGRFGDLPGETNSAAIVLFLAIGLSGLGILPLPRWMRAAASPFYVVGMLVVILVWSFFFPCAALARCL